MLVTDRLASHPNPLRRLAFNEALSYDIHLTEDAIFALQAHLERLRFLKFFSDRGLHNP